MSKTARTRIANACDEAREKGTRNITELNEIAARHGLHGLLWHHYRY